MTTLDEQYLAWKQWGTEEFAHLDVVEARYFVAELGHIVNRSSRVLELGFGNGNFLRWCRDRGSTVWGVETNADLRDRASKMLGPDRVFGTLNDPGLDGFVGSFDLVAAFDVVEHIRQEDLIEVFRRFRGLLSPTGKVFLRFPNGDSPFGRLTQHGDVTHLTTIGRHKLLFLAQSAGLHVECLRAPSLPIRNVGLGRGLRRAGVLAGRFVFERIASTLYFSGQHIPLDQNYVSILRRSEQGVLTDAVVTP